MNRQFDPLNAQNENVGEKETETECVIGCVEWNGMEWMDLARALTTETVATDDENTTETKVSKYARTRAVFV